MPRKYRIKVETDKEGNQWYYPQRRIRFIFPFLSWWEDSACYYSTYYRAMERISNWKEIERGEKTKRLVRYIENL
jgi:hypothetical protein